MFAPRLAAATRTGLSLRALRFDSGQSFANLLLELRLALLLLLVAAGAAEGVESDLTYRCTNGRDPAQLSYRDYMKEFVVGPCAPVVLAPGIGGSVMQVEVECELLRFADFETFLACGWLDCKAGSKHAPAREYRIWVPHLESPMTIVSPLDVNKKCWGGLVEMKYDNIAGQLVPVPKLGVRVRVAGATPGTSNVTASACGLNSIKDMVPDIVNPEVTGYFAAFVKRLRLMGYKEGLSVLGLPYDFRKGHAEDDFRPMLEHSLAELHKLTGKRSVVVGHSMANNRMLNALWKMSQADKDKLIHNYFALAPSYLGAAKPIHYLLCGDSELHAKYNLGIDFKRFVQSIGTFMSTYQLAPSRVYHTERHSAWMKEVQNRIRYERGETDTPGEIDFVPGRDQVCYPSYDKRNCTSGLYELDHYGSLESTPIDNENYRELIDRFGINRDFSSVWRLWEEKFEFGLPNPGVQINIVYTSVLDTEGGYHFKQNPREFTDQHKFCPDDAVEKKFVGGDTTVPCTASVTPGYKWALEFKKGQKDSKPIKFIEMCSAVNTKQSVYDGKDAQGVLRASKNEYIGLPCDCSQDKQRHCNHGSMLFLPQLLDLVSDALQTQQVAPLPAYVDDMTDEQLTQYVFNCKALLASPPTELRTDSE